jgi:hypothetical protein
LGILSSGLLCALAGVIAAGRTVHNRPHTRSGPGQS